MPLTHYVVVRRGLPFGVTLAMVAHAAGESFYLLASQETHELLQVEGFQPDQTVAIVLGARNEGRLEKLVKTLIDADVAHVPVHETEGEYAGQLMAVGLVPGEKDVLARYVRDFHMLTREAGELQDADAAALREPTT